MRIAPRRLLLCLVLVISACSHSGGQPPAMAVNPGSDSPTGERAPEGPSTAEPSAREIAEAVRSSDPGRAVNLLMNVQCLPYESAGVREIRQAWIERDALTSTQAMHDELVRTLAAKCVVDSSQVVATDADVKNTAASQLRGAMIGPNSQAANVAMMAIHVVANSEDVETIAAMAIQKPDTALSAASALIKICGPAAAAALKRVVAFYEGSSMSQRLDAEVAQMQAVRTSICGIEAGQPRSAENLTPVTLPGEPDAAQTRAALAAATPAIAKQTLLALHCGSNTTGAAGEILQAWKERDSPRATAITRDPLVRAIMAKCILWLGPHSGESQEDWAAAADLLRSALHTDNTMIVIQSMEGLARTSLQSDLMTIAEVPRRLPALRNPALWDVSSSCAPDMAGALAELRASASTDSEREAVDATFKGFAADRSRVCAHE
jgi:hypothetical protein